MHHLNHKPPRDKFCIQRFAHDWVFFLKIYYLDQASLHFFNVPPSRSAAVSISYTKTNVEMDAPAEIILYSQIFLHK